MTKRNVKISVPGRDIIPERLEKARTDKGYSRPELGRLAHTIGQTIEKIEKGENKSSAYVILIARALNVNPEWLTGLTDEASQRSKIRRDVDDLLNEFSDQDLPKVYDVLKGIRDLSAKEST